MIFVQLPIKIQVFYTPELARPLQMTVCTLTFAKHTIILGPERVYCRRQLRYDFGAILDFGGGAKRTFGTTFFNQKSEN